MSATPRADATRTATWRPTLPSGVRLAGEMQDTSFEEQQWLVEREGRFAQVSGLLYHVLEQVDGRRNVEEIARAASDRAGRTLAPADALELLERRLVPAGLVAPPPTGGRGERVRRFFRMAVAGPARQVLEDAEAPRPRSAAGSAGSPTGINLRVVALRPGLIEPVTGVLQFLFTPVVAVTLLAMTGVCHIWLYLFHGVAGGIHEVLYTPGLVPATFGLLTASAAFHEFGHAAALRYGGGRVRGMGAGFYFVYPTFFTDVTENYRLPRWARVRTDLGGFFFNLVFTLGLFALHGRTGWEFPLLAVMLIDIEILHQLLPIGRLDGYWLLADLAGVPDFFSLIGPYLRSVLPRPLVAWWRGPTLPPLKRWARAVLSIYTLVAVPLMALLFLLAVRGAPRVLVTAHDALATQAAALERAWRAGDAVGAAGAAVQALLLCLPAIGVAVMLGATGRAALGALWRWSRPTAQRRAGAALATAAVAAVLVLLWAPQVRGKAAHSLAAEGGGAASVEGVEVATTAPATHTAPAAEAAANDRGAGQGGLTPIRAGERGTLPQALGAAVPPARGPVQGVTATRAPTQFGGGQAATASAPSATAIATVTAAIAPTPTVVATIAAATAPTAPAVFTARSSPVASPSAGSTWVAPGAATTAATTIATGAATTATAQRTQGLPTPTVGGGPTSTLASRPTSTLSRAPSATPGASAQPAGARTNT